MKVEKENLIDVLSLVKPAIGKKDVLDSLSGFLFTGESVMAYNDQIRIECPFVSDFSCVVSAEELFRLLQGIKEDSIDISLEDQHLSIKSSGTEAELSIISDGETVLEPMGFNSKKDLKWESLPENFIEGMSLCLFSVSKDISQGALTCIYVGEQRIFSSDNYRISMYEHGGISDSVLIPFGAATELVKFNVKLYCHSDSWFHFKTEEGVIFTTRIVKADFPDCLPFFTEVEGGLRLRIPKEAKESVDALIFFAEGEQDIDKKIKVTFNEGAIFCKGESKLGWVEKKIPIPYKRKPVSFMINPVFFSQILKNIASVTLLKDKALFKSGNFSHILALPAER
jgi:DNA polymerase III sliding clamp (beta) subunit (PCNA family)